MIKELNSGIGMAASIVFTHVCLCAMTFVHGRDSPTLCEVVFLYLSCRSPSSKTWCSAWKEPTGCLTTACGKEAASTTTVALSCIPGEQGRKCSIWMLHRVRHEHSIVASEGKSFFLFFFLLYYAASQIDLFKFASLTAVHKAMLLTCDWPLAIVWVY